MRETDSAIPEFDFSSPFLLVQRGIRVIQIQPSLRCNLSCAHCYSESGPGKSGEVPIKLLEDFLAVAKALGFGYVGVSGGEPLLWRDLNRFLDYAGNIGFSTSVITNGTLLTPSRAAELRGRVGLVAVSVEGPARDHDAIRGPGAFSAMVEGLTALRKAEVRFLLMFTLTMFNAARLSWLYKFAEETGAEGVEIHPLVSTGAAGNNLPNAVPDSVELEATARLLALLMELRGRGGPAVILDVMKREMIRRSAWPMFSQGEDALRTARFSDIVPALVVEPDGAIVPFIYGFPRKWAVGSITDGSLRAAASRWRNRFAAEVAGLVGVTIKRLEGADYLDLFGELLETARGAFTKRKDVRFE